MEHNFDWCPPVIKTESIKTGDMPGDKVLINDSHVDLANKIYPHLRNRFKSIDSKRFVVSVYGGSGVGKSEIGSILAHYSTLDGFNSYVLSGDNYPHRIPKENDRERLGTFRNAGLNALSERADFKDQWMKRLGELWESMEDFKQQSASESDFEWREVYFEAGKKALHDYLGTSKEINFEYINRIIHSFKNGEKQIILKKMGRIEDDIKLESVNFSKTQILFIEWAHGNNPQIKGIDFPIFLYSSPEETLAHRLSRSRDNNIDNPFINLVLSIEQQKLTDQTENAKLIVNRDGEIL